MTGINVTMAQSVGPEPTLPNRIMQTVLAADFVTVGSPVRHKQDNATIVKRLDTSRNFVK